MIKLLTSPKGDFLTNTTVSKHLFCKPTGKHKGRGVFSTNSIKNGALVEHAPVMPIPKADVIPDSAIDNYVLVWNAQTESEQYCLVGGFVMLYNHSDTPNVKLEEDRENIAFRVTALRDIKKGEEIVWDYNCELWFDPEQ